MEEGGSLIPGLANDLAISCLIRVPRIYHLRMRAVNSQWRSLLLKPSSTFHTLRKLHAFTDRTLFLLERSNDFPLNRLECTEIDLASGKKSKGTFRNESVREMIIQGHACVSHAALVIVLGGCDTSSRAYNTVHIFDTRQKMDSRRRHARPPGGFAWGLIGDRLYVAGGFGGGDVGNIAAAEVYDFEAKEWREISSMPVSMTVHVFFVVSGKLLVRGWVPERQVVEAYSYCPLTNVWEHDNWMFRVLEPVERVTLNTFGIARDENEYIFMVELSKPFSVWGSSTDWLYLSISKLNNATLECVRVCQILDRAESDFCDCSDFDRYVRFHGLKDGVVVLSHDQSDNDSDYKEVEVTSVCGHVLKVTVTCPSRLCCAVVNA